MYQARLKDGEMINSLKLPTTFTEETLVVCPDCGEEVALRYSRNGKPYFSHVKKYDPYHNGYGESEEHFTGKRDLMWMCKEQGILAQDEVPLADAKRRGDVYLPELKRVFEVQCSPISSEELIERTNCYAEEGIQVCWIFGNRYSLDKFLNKQQRNVLNYHPNLGYYFLQMWGGRFFIYYNIRLWRRKLRYQVKGFSSENLEKVWDLPNLSVDKAPVNPVMKRDIEWQKNEISRGIMLNAPAIMKEQYYFYYFLLNFRLMPDSFFALLVYKLPFVVGTGAILHHVLLKMVRDTESFTLQKLRNLWKKTFEIGYWVDHLPFVTPEEQLESYLRFYLPIMRANGFCKIKGDCITFSKERLNELFSENYPEIQAESDVYN